MLPPSVELYREFDHLKSAKQILERIVSGEDCTDGKECLSCPLAKWKRSDKNDRWLSCFEAVIGVNDDITAEQINERYKESAKHVLAVKTIDELIGVQDDEQKT